MGNEALLAAVAKRFALGRILATPGERHGGVNQLWRLQTTRGAFAIHALLGLPPNADPISRCQRVFDLEVAAAGAGVRVAQPVPDPISGQACVQFGPDLHPVIVHAWIDAEPTTVERSPPAFYSRLGRSLGHIHSLALPTTPAQPDSLTTHPSAHDWRAVALDARSGGWPWAEQILGAADELEAGLRTIDECDLADPDAVVFSHRDLTSQNVLDDAGDPVLIDWEDAGPIGRGNEIGRTALDNLGRDGVLDPVGLRAYLSGYSEVAPLPAPGRHWCSLWIRGLIVFAYHCAQSCIAATATSSLAQQQSSVVATTVSELRRRLSLTDELVDAFANALPR